jgi:hypothetical protein
MIQKLAEVNAAPAGSAPPSRRPHERLERNPVMFVRKRSRHGSENSCILQDELLQKATYQADQP